MNKALSILATLLLINTLAFSQVGIGTITPSAAAELDVTSPANNTGVLVPILTDAQVSGNLVPNQPPHGSLIYNQDKAQFMYNAGTAASPQWAFVGQAPLSEDVTAIASPFEGDLRYDRATNSLRFYNGTTWKTLQP